MHADNYPHRKHFVIRTGWVAFQLMWVVVFFWPFSARGGVKASRGEILLPTYPWAAVKHPYFRGTDGVNIYPYPMLDFLSREKTNRTYRTVVLENEYLRITFLPELGGKVHEVINQTTGQPMFYVNHVIKPGLIGQCGGWISGGIEWNTGPQGHTVSCLQPVDVLILPQAADGSRSVAIGEMERIYGTKWTVVVTLRPGRSFLEERIRIYNPTEYIRPYYFWNCTAAPNTQGFRFIYPMTLGTDHSSVKYFQWPIHEGKDLSRGTNYQDASSIFAYGCDQDFFGSYNDDLDRGVVACANYHQVPGKKAWTWGWGSYGAMHQMDLTDSDGPYNEVQTGPLLTQGEVGRLDPCEAVEWQEWWYPIHGLGGFMYANRDLAVNADTNDGKLRLRILSTGTWKNAELTVTQDKRFLGTKQCDLTPRKPVQLSFSTANPGPVEVILVKGKQTLASFRYPQDLPVRTPPEKKPPVQTAAAFAQSGWQHYLFARFPEAETEFRRALEKDSKCLEAYLGLACLNQDRDPEASVKAARAVLEVNPLEGRARFILAAQELAAVELLDKTKSEFDEETALDEAWQSSLDPTVAAAGRALAARISLRRGNPLEAIEAMSGDGPWQGHPLGRNLLALAFFKTGDPRKAVELAVINLNVDPLDAFARSILWLAKAKEHSISLAEQIAGQAQSVLDLAIDYANLGEHTIALRVLETFYFAVVPKTHWDLLPCYWGCFLAGIEPAENSRAGEYRSRLETARALRTDVGFPSRPESLAVLAWYSSISGKDDQESLLRGHLLFHLGRTAEARASWKKAAEQGVSPVIAYRALGMASLTLDQDLDSAIRYLNYGHEADRTDAIIARDLARVWFRQLDRTDSATGKQELARRIRDILQAAYAAGQGRSDFVTLLGRAQNRLGEYAATAKMLDSVRVTIWEGAHEIHDLFEAAHLALGEASLKAARAEEALAEFNRALEYPANLATGRLENTREAHIHYLRGKALAALGRNDAAREAWQKAAAEPASNEARIETARKLAQEELNLQKTRK